MSAGERADLGWRAGRSRLESGRMSAGEWVDVGPTSVRPRPDMKAGRSRLDVGKDLGWTSAGCRLDVGWTSSYADISADQPTSARRRHVYWDIYTT